MKFLQSFLFSFVVIVLFVQTRAAIPKGGIVGCYYGTWSENRLGYGRFTPDNIDPNICTHIFYAFLGIDEYNEITSLNKTFDKPYNLVDGNIAKTVALKIENKNVKILASVGGWSAGSEKFSKMAASQITRGRFIRSVVKFIVGNHLDGVDIDWEYPAQRPGSSLEDFDNFVLLLKELSAALKPRGLLLTIAVASSISSIRMSYDIPNIMPSVDFVNLMAYDYSGPWQKVSGLNAPLQSAGINNVRTSTEYWLANGAPPEKLVLGLATYGRTFSLVNSSNTEPGAPVYGVGKSGPYTNASGILSYAEICKDLRAGGWEKRWDADSLVPYAFKGNQWVSFDDEKSLNLKIKFIKSKNLAGAMIWSLENDDFRGLCGEKYPLLRTVYKGVMRKRSILDFFKNVFHF